MRLFQEGLICSKGSGLQCVTAPSPVGAAPARAARIDVELVGASGLRGHLLEHGFRRRAVFGLVVVVVVGAIIVVVVVVRYRRRGLVIVGVHREEKTKENTTQVKKTK